MADQRVGAVVVHEDTVLNANGSAIAVYAAVKRLPSSGFPELVRAGGLIAYGINFLDTDYRAAAFVDKILKGRLRGPFHRALDQVQHHRRFSDREGARACAAVIAACPRRRGDRIGVDGRYWSGSVVLKLRFPGFDPSDIGRHLMLQKASSETCLPFLCSFLTAKKRPHSEAAKVTRKDRFIYQR